MIQSYQIVGIHFASSELVHKQLENVPASTHDDWIDNLVDSLQRQTLKSNILDFNDVKSALKDLQRAGGQVVQLPETEDSKRATVRMQLLYVQSVQSF